MKIHQSDLDILNKLTFDSSATSSFEYVKYCLIWSDERPANRLSAEGQELLNDLWSIRGFIHRSVPTKEWGLDPKYFEDVWNFGLKQIPEWPGFKRIVLSEAEKAYLTDCLNSPFW